MKLTKSKLKQIIKEELEQVGGDSWHEEYEIADQKLKSKVQEKYKGGQYRYPIENTYDSVIEEYELDPVEILKNKQKWDEFWKIMSEAEAARSGEQSY